MQGDIYILVSLEELFFSLKVKTGHTWAYIVIRITSMEWYQVLGIVI